jgi:mannose-6-phosphate isomerase-like protein (cupin superfamily)
MSKTLFRSAALAVLALCAAGAGAQEIQDSTVADPDVHQVMLENDHVRVLRALAAHGYKSPMHSHPPLLVVSLGTGRVRITQADGKKQILDLQPGTAIWIDGTQHSWELLAGEVNVVAVEVKAAKAAKTAAKTP